MKNSKRKQRCATNKRVIIAISIATISLAIIWRAIQIDFNDLSATHLKNAGFYTYVLPSSLKHTWDRNISMKSFDYHCYYDGDSRDDRWNYIHVKYFDKTGENSLTIRVSPNDALFHDDVALSLQIESEIFDSDALYYVVNGFPHILMKDQNDLEVVIASSMTIEDTISYAESIVPIGKYSDENPWARCN